MDRVCRQGVASAARFAEREDWIVLKKERYTDAIGMK
jgi:hypothetical protein